jgi:hypothetical protein
MKPLDGIDMDVAEVTMVPAIPSIRRETHQTEGNVTGNQRAQEDLVHLNVEISTDINRSIGINTLQDHCKPWIKSS